MTSAKTELFNPGLQQAALFFKVLSHPARLQILQYLADTKSCISGDISEELPLGRTTVSQHLKELKELRLITSHSEGVKTKYCLNPEKVNELKQTLQFFLNNLNTENYECE